MTGRPHSQSHPFPRRFPRFYQFRAALQSGSLSEAEAVHGELQIDLHAIRAALDRQATSSRVASQEMDYYAAEQAKLEASIEEV